MINIFVGEIAALAAAFLWAASSLGYGRLGQRVPPLTLNLIKGAIAIFLIIITLVLQALITQDFTLLTPQIPPTTLGLILLSGLVGIGLGDTAYFHAINHLGARKALLMETIASPLSAFLALIFLQEKLSNFAWAGIFLTLLGVVWVISERTPEQGGQPHSQLWMGIGWGLLSALGQATGAVLSRSAFIAGEVNTLWSTLLRLMGGLTIVIILLNTQSAEKSDKIGAVFASKQLLATLVVISFGSTYLGIWLQQISLKFAPAGIAQTLLGTSPLFVLPLVMLLGERVSFRAYLGVMVAIAGIALLFAIR
jgi:drug/metabolite transporter (DMT)-like permease